MRFTGFTRLCLHAADGEAAEMAAEDRRIASTSMTGLADCRHGRMLYLSADHLTGRSLAFHREYCEGEGEVFSQLLGPGQTVVEAGAKIGVHTVALAKLVGSAGAVHAFEPQRVIF